MSLGSSEASTTMVGAAPVPLEDEHTAIGSGLGRYAVLEEIGRGAMGRVLRAYDPKLQREVALKEVRRSVLGATGTARLIAEARAMAKLSHPNVVAVFDVEELGTELALVMEYIPGTTLARWLREQERDWQKIVTAFIEAGRGLAAAHAAGLLHRDFKPANVLVGFDQHVKVTDFGLAKGVDAGSTAPGSGKDTGFSAEDLTEAAPELPSEASGRIDGRIESWVLGTPRYMAPEQHGGQLLSAAADQYAFCVALWEALHGKPPFSGPSMAANKREGAPAWSNSAVPRPVAETIERGLSPRPTDRWPDMEALLEALAHDPARRRNRWLAGLSAIAVVGVGATVFASWSQARAKRCSGAAEHLAGVWDDTRREHVEAAILGTGASYAQGVWERTASRLDDYAEAWTTMYTQACEATTLRGEQSEAAMDLRMACLHRARVDLGAAVGVLATADARVVQKAHRVLGDLRPLWRCADVEGLRADVDPPAPEDAEAVERARSLLAEARVERLAARYGSSKTKVESAKEALADVDYAPVLAELAMAEGEVLDELGQYEAAVEALERGVEVGARSQQWHLVAGGLTRLIFVVGFRQRKMTEGLRYAPAARGLTRDPESEGALSGAIAIILQTQGRHKEAEAEERHALALRTTALGPEHPSIAASRNNLANALADQGRYGEAEAELRLALASLEKSLGLEHPHVAIARNNLASILVDQKKYEGAEAEFRRALALSEKALGPDHPAATTARANLASVLGDEGKHAEAEAEHRRVLALRQRTLGADHPDTAMTRSNLAGTFKRQRKYDEAEAEFRRALAISEKALGPDHPDIAAIRYNLASTLLELGRPEEALVFAELAWSHYQREDIPAQKRGMTAFVLARALWQADSDDPRREGARSMAERARKEYRDAGQAYARRLEVVETWLQTHPVP